MKLAQTNKILDLLQNNEWTCTSDMYRLFMADPRRRLCDLRDKGYNLESRKCRQHNYHAGGSKEWRLVEAPKQPLTRKFVLDESTGRAREIWV